MIKCFYHRIDLDGHCSGAIIKKKFSNVKLIGIDYNDIFPWEEIDKDCTIYMVDFSLSSPEDMISLYNSCNFIWIDHHESALKQSKEYGYDKYIDGIRSLDKAGCELTWEYCFSKKIPLHVWLAGRYDVWQHHEDERILPYQAGSKLYKTFPNNDSFWKPLWDNDTSFLNNIIAEGQTVLKYESIMNHRICKSQSYTIKFHGIRFLAINRSFINSKFFDTIYDPSLHDAVMSYSYLHKNNVWRVSIYTSKTDEIDLSILAKQYGGGGHKGAAGFLLNVDDIGLILKK